MDAGLCVSGHPFGDDFRRGRSVAQGRFVLLAQATGRRRGHPVVGEWCGLVKESAVMDVNRMVSSYCVNINHWLADLSDPPV